MIEIYASQEPKKYVPAPFSRAPFFLVRRSDGKWSYIVNPYKDFPRDVAKNVVFMLAPIQPDVVYAKEFGYKAQQYLKQKRIRFEVKDRVIQ